MPRTAITVFLRFDDYCATSPAVVERGFVDALRRTGHRATLAVIPALTEGSYHEPGERRTVPLGDEKTTFLKRAAADGVVDVALHGWNHRTRFSAPPHAEFVGLPLAEQSSRIEQGLAILRDAAAVDPVVFVPPWNRYDHATLEALERHGMRGISANRYGPVVAGSLSYIPITIEMPTLRRAVEEARSSGDPEPVIGVLLHPYDFHESGDARATLTRASFEADLEWLNSQPDVSVTTISELATAGRAFDAKRYLINSPLPIEHIAPSFVRRTGDTLFLRSIDEGRRRRRWRAAQILGVQAAIGLAGFAVCAFTHAVLGSSPSVTLATAAIAGLALTLLAIRAVRQGEIFFRGMATVSLLLGVLASGLVAALM